MSTVRISGIHVGCGFLLLSLILWSFRCPGVGPQSPGTPQIAREDQANASLSGRVKNDFGRPIAGARVIIRQLGASGGTALRATKTDRDGRFKVESLPNGSYKITASSPGYFMREESASSPDAGVYNLGDSANIVLFRGGVITGSVHSAGAEPVVAINVRATRVRDQEGKAVTKTFSMERQTDDRGVYRIYGLEPGTYVVEAGGSDRSSLNQNNYRVQTFYPSEMRNTAREIRVDEGTETNGIDIIVRNESGHSISGYITAGFPNVNFLEVSLRLFDATTSQLVHDTSLRLDDRNNGFAIHGIPDGRYELFVLSNFTLPGSFSVKSIKVEGVDIENVRIGLVRLGSATGRIQVEPLRPGPDSITCQTSKESPLESVTVKADLDVPEIDARNLSFANTVAASVSNDAEFRLMNLRAGLYRIMIKPTDGELYLKSAVLPGRTLNSSSNPALSEKPWDVANQGLPVKPGEEIKNIILTLAPGAAELRGKLILSSGERQPPGVRLHLTPAEPEYANAISRYAETLVKEDGTFVLTNLIPGRYFVATSTVANDSKSSSPRPLAWDFNGRAELRRLAGAEKISVELRPCGRLTNFDVRYRHSPAPSTNTNR